ncbi:hypothetical protein V499_02629 [Pseudogymnoascus sp. VKM F-103]|nr:hypothetical protein V499_02629 [Pseudogymnoascus sp. VKM F-103]
MPLKSTSAGLATCLTVLTGSRTFPPNMAVFYAQMTDLPRLIVQLTGWPRLADDAAYMQPPSSATGELRRPPACQGFGAPREAYK